VRRAALLVLVAGLVLALAASAHAALVTQDIDFTASDGVVLHATIGGEGGISPRPLIIEDSPYAPACCDAFAGPAYNYVQLQWRGTGRSGGSFSTTGRRDQLDLSEFVDWACRQPFSDGRIGLYGFSASAIAVYNALHLPLPCVKAAALMAGTVDLYRDLLYIGGIQNSAPGLYVLGAVFAPWLQNLPRRMQDQPASVPDSLRGYASASPDVQLHPTEDDYWQDRSYKGNPARIPILADTGFYDVEARGPFLAYRDNRDAGAHLLVIGAHDGSPAGSGGPFPHYARWFDHHVRGIDNGVDREPPVSVYLSNGSREELLAGHTTHLTGDDWPLPGTRWTRLYLSPDRSGTARSVNDGTLAPRAPGARAAQSYPFHPSNPFATDPHTTATIAGLGLDQLAHYLPQLTRMDLAEPTALTFTTAPLASDLNAVGPAALDLYASSTAPETDLVAVVADVWPDGTAHPVATGQLRTSFPDVDVARSLKDPATGDLVQPYSDFSAKRPAAPGEVREYHVEMPPIGNHFAAGHRIRLYVLGTSGYMQPPPPAVNTLALGGATPSRLILPEGP
jgi:putative CocE/NonD family hydrolase